MVISPCIHPIFSTDLWGCSGRASLVHRKLRKDLDSTLALDLPSFENEAVAWSNFLLASCFMMVFLFGGLVQYLSPLDDLENWGCGDVDGWLGDVGCFFERF